MAYLSQVSPCEAREHVHASAVGLPCTCYGHQYGHLLMQAHLLVLLRIEGGQGGGGEGLGCASTSSTQSTTTPIVAFPRLDHSAISDSVRLFSVTSTGRLSALSALQHAMYVSTIHLSVGCVLLGRKAVVYSGLCDQYRRTQCISACYVSVCHLEQSSGTSQCQWSTFESSPRCGMLCFCHGACLPRATGGPTIQHGHHTVGKPKHPPLLLQPYLHAMRS